MADIGRLIELVSESSKAEREAHKKIEALMFEIASLNKKNKQLQVELSVAKERYKWDLDKGPKGHRPMKKS